MHKNTSASNGVLYDSHAWAKWPHHRRWFNKLDFSLRMGYRCGPCGTAPDLSGEYIVRPIYNLSGMGVGASKMWIDAGNERAVPPGYFWCEWFSGPQYSVTYLWENSWVPLSSWQGFVNPDNLSRFEKWVRSEVMPAAPLAADELFDVGVINIEWIGTNPIEVHLRPSPDPDDGNEIIPVWADSDEQLFIPSFDDADGHLSVPRLGFIIR